MTVDSQSTSVALPINKQRDNMIFAYEEGSDNYVFGFVWSKEMSTYGYRSIVGNKTLTLGGSSGSIEWIENCIANTRIKYLVIQFAIS